MPNDANANVMKIVVGKNRNVPLLIGQSVAQIAARLCVEQFPTALGRIAYSILVSGYEMIEGRVE
jgi:hypothetical protein